MPASLCDLHLHTHYSDGKASPGELLRHASAIGLKTVAITDHDNCNAAGKAILLSQELGLELIPGIEITTRWQPCSTKFEYGGGTEDIDLLGYCMDISREEFKQLIHDCMDDCYRRFAECCVRLTKDGFPISIHQVMEENPRSPSPISLLNSLIHTHNAKDLPEAYSLFIQYWPTVSPCACSIYQAIQAIHQAGGVAVLAHPVAVYCDDAWITARQLELLVEAGLDGLEIAHPRMTDEARRHFMALAEQFELLTTGGSDEHSGPPHFSRIGSQIITGVMVRSLQQRAMTYPIRT